jgi:fumarylpyruvate hydrolase
MTSLLFPLAPPTIPIVGDARVFPVRRIYCIGRNYAAHAREMGGNPDREPPFFFMKPADAVQVVPYHETVAHPYPPGTQDYHHEIEMVVALHSGGRDIAEADALSHVFGYAVGLDMTRRDRQAEAKKMQRPWEIGKAAEASAVVGPIHPASVVGHLAAGPIRVAVDGAMRQDARLEEMIWSVPEQIAILSRFYELRAGDLIFSGTPEGVGEVKRGQTMTGSVGGLGEIAVRVV